MSIQSSRLSYRVSEAQIPDTHNWYWDHALLSSMMMLIVLGIVMVTSASIATAEVTANFPFYYAIRQAIFVTIGITSGIIILKFPLNFWEKLGGLWLILAFLLLVVVLIIGKEVNGGTRWIGLGFVNVQVSEIAKLLLFMYLGAYLSRFRSQVTTSFMVFIKPVIVFFMAVMLLVLEPDLGSSAVLLATAIGVLFLAGVRLGPLFLLLLVCILGFVALVLLFPERIDRFKSFLDPFQDATGEGYQLVQALIAIGNGEVFGRGLGESVQKLFYLPEAHTDFIFAILAEELGLIGVIALIILYMVLLWRAFRIAAFAEALEQYFATYLAYAIGLWMGLQVVINMSVNMGLVPTKGLTLPFISYGGSSIVMMCIAGALLLRIHHECQSAYRKRLVRRARS